jgi:hypothetical protein
MVISRIGGVQVSTDGKDHDEDAGAKDGKDGTDTQDGKDAKTHHKHSITGFLKKKIEKHEEAKAKKRKLKYKPTFDELRAVGTQAGIILNY